MRGTAILLGCAIFLAFGIGDIERGNRFYREGRYAEAVEAYQAALRDGESSPELRYNLGTALLRLRRYEEAERHLRAALASIEPNTRERTHYNLGGRYLQAGRESVDPRARAQLLDAAVEAYRQALRVQPGDVDAKWNLELALREKERQPPSQQGGGGEGGSQRDPQAPQSGGGNNQAPAGPTPSGARTPRDGGSQGAMTREQAERLLSAVEQDERELYRDKLRKGRRDTPVARDW